MQQLKSALLLPNGFEILPQAMLITKKSTHLSIIEHNRLNNVHGVSSPGSHRLGRVQMRINRCADLKAQTSYRQLMENKHSLRWIKG